MTDTHTNTDTDGTAPTDRTAALARAFELLTDDDLDGFVLATSADGELRAMSSTPLDEAPAQYADRPPCRLPRNVLLGKLLGDVAVMYGMDPPDLADVTAHVATDHLGIDADTVDAMQRELRAGGAGD